MIPGVLANAVVDCKSFQRKELLWHLPTLCHTGTFFPHSCVNVSIVTQKWHAMQRYKRAHYGHLPPKMRRQQLFYKATEEGCGFVTTSSILQSDYEHMVPGMIKDDFDLNPHFGPDPTGRDD